MKWFPFCRSCCWLSEIFPIGAIINSQLHVRVVPMAKASLAPPYPTCFACNSHHVWPHAELLTWGLLAKSAILVRFSGRCTTKPVQNGRVFHVKNERTLDASFPAHSCHPHRLFLHRPTTADASPKTLCSVSSRRKAVAFCVRSRLFQYLTCLSYMLAVAGSISCASCAPPSRGGAFSHSCAPGRSPAKAGRRLRTVASFAQAA